MPVDAQTQKILDALAELDAPPITDQDPATIRETYAASKVMAATVETVATEDLTIPGPAGDIPVRRYTPEGGGTGPGVVYFHGGGFVIGDLETHDGVCRSLADRTGFVVVAVDYRLAPEHPFPAAADDALAAFDGIRKRAAEFAVDPDRLAVAGDSAGGNLAAVVAVERRGQVRFQLLVYPVTDLTRDTPSFHDNAEGYMLTADAMRWFEGHYLGDADPTDPRVSPAFREDVADLAPAFVMTAEFDPLRDEGEAYAEKLVAAGNDVEVRRYDGLIHGFFSMGAVVDAADAAFDDAVKALRGALA